MSSQEIKQTVELAMWGLSLQAESIVEAVTGTRPNITEEQYQCGPFAQALYRLADIASTGNIQNQEQAKKDVLLVFRFYDKLGNNFQNLLKPALDMALEAIGELITIQEAAAILDVSEVSIQLDIDSDLLHPLMRKDGETYIILLARYEVEHIKKTLVRHKKKA
jgi:hypothetical protein